VEALLAIIDNPLNPFGKQPHVEWKEARDLTAFKWILSLGAGSSILDTNTIKLSPI
jgi:hypothetical protein